MTNDFFEEVVNLHHADLYRFAMSLARHPDDAGDLVQETYMTFARKGDQIRDPSKAKQWLFTTLYRAFTASYHRAKRSVSLDHPDAPEPEHVAPKALRHIEHRELRDILRSLDEKHRAVLCLHYLDDLSYKEVAGILDIPIGTVMSRLSRAKAMMRAKLEKSLAREGINQTTRHSNPGTAHSQNND